MMESGVMNILSIIGGAVAAFALARPVSAEVRFNRDIRPILSDRCYVCHGPDPGNRKTAMRFDQEQSAKAALKSGKFAIVAGKPSDSELYIRITSSDNARRMPPAYAGHAKLPDREIETIRQWIAEGAR